MTGVQTCALPIFAAKLTGYKIDIKSESQAQESGLLDELGMASYDEDGSAVYEQGEYEGNAFGANADADEDAANVDGEEIAEAAEAVAEQTEYSEEGEISEQ